MRTFEEILADAKHAVSVDNSNDILRCAEELEALNTTEATAAALMYRGLALFLRSNFPLALEHYRRSLRLAEEMGNRASIASAKQNIGDVYLCTGNYPFALEHYHQSLDLYKELGNQTGVAFVTNGIGCVYLSTGNYPLALEHFHQTLDIHEELGNRDGIATVKSNIGIVYAKTGNYPLALEHFHHSLALYEDLGNSDGVATELGNIGSVYLNTGNYPLALEHYHRAMAVFEELGNRDGEAMFTGSIGDVYLGMGNYPVALEHYHRALALYEVLGNRAGVAHQTSNAGIAFVEAKQYEQAKAMLNVMESIQIDEPSIVNKREQIRAAIQENSGEFGSAVATLSAALELANHNALASDQADIRKQLRDLCRKMNDFEGYIEHNNEYTRITEEINGKDTATKLAMQEKQREIDAERKEHDRHMAVLHSTLPKHIADRVARGETVNDHHENAAVIFLDIVGFTPISDRIPSGHVVHLLEQIFSTLDAVCKRNDVVKIKTIGDSYMAVSFDNVQNAATCALDMITSLDELVITMPPALGDTSWTKDIGDIKVRIGMHCGPVTAGVIGTDRMQYDVWGDTVNVASRMESTSEPGKIQVSEAFANALKTSPPNLLSSLRGGTSSPFPVPCSLRERGALEIKGKGMMTTFWLERL